MLKCMGYIIAAAKSCGSIHDISILNWDPERNGKRLFLEGTTLDGKIFTLEFEVKDPENKQEDEHES